MHDLTIYSLSASESQRLKSEATDPQVEVPTCSGAESAWLSTDTGWEKVEISFLPSKTFPPAKLAVTSVYGASGSLYSKLYKS